VLTQPPAVHADARYTMVFLRVALDTADRPREMMDKVRLQEPIRSKPVAHHVARISRRRRYDRWVHHRTAFRF